MAYLRFEGLEFLVVFAGLVRGCTVLFPTVLMILSGSSCAFDGKYRVLLRDFMRDLGVLVEGLVWDLECCL